MQVEKNEFALRYFLMTFNALYVGPFSAAYGARMIFLIQMYLIFFVDALTLGFIYVIYFVDDTLP